MADFREILLTKALKKGHASEYNQVSCDLRMEGENPSYFYAVVLEDHHSWEDIRNQIYPNLTRFLRYRRLNPERAKGLTVALFFQDHDYLIEAPSFMEAFREMEGLDSAGFQAQVRKWLESTSP